MARSLKLTKRLSLSGGPRKMMSGSRMTRFPGDMFKIFSVESSTSSEDLKTRTAAMINGEALDPGFAKTHHGKRSGFMFGSTGHPVWDGIGREQTGRSLMEDDRTRTYKKGEEPRNLKGLPREERRS